MIGVTREENGRIKMRMKSDCSTGEAAAVTVIISNPGCGTVLINMRDTGEKHMGCMEVSVY